MDTKVKETQINELNTKVDLLLEYVNEQRLRSHVIEDLLADLNIIGKDAFQTAVNELENNACEVDLDNLKLLAFKFLRNMKNFHKVFDMFESTVDFLNDASPLINESLIDLTHKLHKFEQRGYFEYFAEMMKTLSEIHHYFTIDDFKNFTQQIPNLIQIFKNITNPKLLQTAERITTTLNAMEMSDEKDNKSLFKIFKQLKSPEVRKTLSYTMRLIQEVNRNQNKNNS